MSKLNGALVVFDRNKMPPLYKQDKSVYTLEEMKAFYNVAQNFDDSFSDWVEDNFEDKFSKVSQEMIKVEKWMAKFSKIRSNIILNLIIQFVSLAILTQEIGIPFDG